MHRPRFVLLLSFAAAALMGSVLLPATAGAAPAGPAAPGAPSPRPAPPTSREWRHLAPSTVIIGRSVEGRLIVAHRHGSADAPHVALVLGSMHGSESRGRAVVAALDTMAPPALTQMWTISTMNPDGASRLERTNSHGVDLNRNWPFGWNPRYSANRYYPGPYAASEPEVRAMLAFLDHLDPALIVSFHQAFNAVDQGAGKAYVWSARLAVALHLNMYVVPCDVGPCLGTMTSWFNHYHRGAAITVELPASVSTAQARRFALGTLAVVRQLSS